MNLLLVLALVQHVAGPATLLAPGEFHGDEVRAVDGDRLLALCGGRLVETVVEIRPVSDPLLDAPDGPPSGRVVAVPCDALALFRGVPGLRPGRLRAAVIRPLGPERLELTLPGRPPAELRRVPLGENGFRVEIGADGRFQPLYSTRESDEGSWSLVWAGDLNRDGRLDLLLRASHHYNVDVLRLFLAGRDGRLHEVAAFQTTGC